MGFWFSLWSALNAGLDSPVGLAPAAVPLAGWAAYLALRRQKAEQPGHDMALDGALGVLLMGGAIWVVLGEPARMGWRYWSVREDLVAFELFALGATCWVFGAGTVWRAKIGLLVLAIGSPPALAWLQDHLAPTMAQLSAAGAHVGAAALRLQFEAGTASDVFRGTSDGGVPYAIHIADVCSGLSSWVSILLTGIPAALYLGLGVGGAVGWLLMGMALASAANVFRIVMLLLAAQHVSPEVALGVIHPVLGAVLLFGVLLVLLFCVEGTPLPPPLGWKVELGTPALSILMAAGAIAGVSQSQLLPFKQLPSGSVPGPSVPEPLAALPALPGYDTALQTEISWQNLFGEASKSYLVHYTDAHGVTVVTQYVATPDLGKLLTYTPERCGVYHGEDVRGQKTVDLGQGQVGFLVDSTTLVPAKDQDPAAGRRPLQFHVLYWYLPMKVADHDWNARFLLILDSDDTQNVPPLPAAERGIAPGGPDFDRVDAQLVSVGRQMMGKLGGA